ncbi:MAG: redox-regulated ATPase YchF [Bacteroides sp.]
MALKCGIVGLPNVGKSTLFNCISSSKAEAANFPFCTIDPNVGVAVVPDERLEKLVAIDHPKKVCPAVVEIVDIAGLVRGASKGEGLGNQFLAHIRETQAIIHVLRCFDDGNVTHVEGGVDPVRDMGIIDTELQLRDQESIESRLVKLEKQARVSNDRTLKHSVELLQRCNDYLLQGHNLRSMELDAEDKAWLLEQQFLTIKPVLYVCNVDVSSAATGNQYVEAVRTAVAKETTQVLAISAQMESEIAELDTPEEQAMFLEEMGLKEAGVAQLIRAAYALLGLETFYTTGEDESRAWTFRKGMKAPQTAGIIHTDFERGFIRAEVIKYADYVRLGSEAACRDAGKLSIEGKDYEVQDGDIMHFRFNV